MSLTCHSKKTAQLAAIIEYIVFFESGNALYSILMTCQIRIIGLSSSFSCFLGMSEVRVRDKKPSTSFHRRSWFCWARTKNEIPMNPLVKRIGRAIKRTKESVAFEFPKEEEEEELDPACRWFCLCFCCWRSRCCCIKFDVRERWSDSVVVVRVDRNSREWGKVERRHPVKRIGSIFLFFLSMMVAQSCVIQHLKQTKGNFKGFSSHSIILPIFTFSSVNCRIRCKWCKVL